MHLKGFIIISDASANRPLPLASRCFMTLPSTEKRKQRQPQEVEREREETRKPVIIAASQLKASASCLGGSSLAFTYTAPLCM